MKNSELLIELIHRIDVYRDQNLVWGISIDKSLGTVSLTTESQALSTTLQTLTECMGMENCLKVQHCKETELYPKMDCMEWDITAMDSLPEVLKAPQQLPGSIACALPEGHPQKKGKTIQMTMMTDEEWLRMVKLTRGSNARMHWQDMGSWVNDTERRYVGYHTDPTDRIQRGWAGPRKWLSARPTDRSSTNGFRPTCNLAGIDILKPGAKDGSTVVIGTLYMNGVPVKVPQNPVFFKGDIQRYARCAKLEMREPLEDPAYQVTGILDGKKAYVDRNLLSHIAYTEIEWAVEE